MKTYHIVWFHSRSLLLQLAMVMLCLSHGMASVVPPCLLFVESRFSPCLRYEFLFENHSMLLPLVLILWLAELKKITSSLVPLNKQLAKFACLEQILEVHFFYSSLPWVLTKAFGPSGPSGRRLTSVYVA